MPFFKRGKLFSPDENNTQVEGGFTPPGSYACAKLILAEKSHLNLTMCLKKNKDFQIIMTQCYFLLNQQD